MNWKQMIWPALTAMILSACGSSPDEAASGTTAPPNGGPEILALIPRDTIGIELGDSCYTFGVVAAAEYTSTGNIIIGDISVMKIRMYSPDCTWLRSGGREGEGPGEFAYPTGAWPTTDGGVAVGDPMAGKVIFYDSLLQLDHEVTGFSAANLQVMAVLASMALVGSSFSFDQETLDVTNRLQRWEPGETESSVTYCVREAVYEPEDPMGIYEDISIHACALPDGRVVATPVSTNEYVLTCYLPDGEVDWVVDIPFERTRRDEEVIETDRELMRAAAARYGGSASMVDEIELQEWSHAVADLQTDGTRIWVRREGTMVPTYDVFNFEGSLLFKCQVPDLPYAAGVQIRFSPFGAIAFEANPMDYSKVILLDLPDLQDGAGPVDPPASAVTRSPDMYDSNASPGLTTCTLTVAEGIEPLILSVYWTAGEDLPTGFASPHTINVAPIAGGEGEDFHVEDSAIPNPLDRSGWLVTEDMDFDGYTDFRLLAFPTAGPNTYWFFWLYDPSSGRFYRADGWDDKGLVSPEFDPEEEVIRCFSRDGYGLYTTQWYSVEDGLPLLIREERSEWVTEDSLVMVTSELVDGSMVETDRTLMEDD